MQARTDPPVSQAQRRWAFANRDKNTAEGRAAAEYAAADPGGKLPERVRHDDESHGDDVFDARVDACVAALDDCVARFDRMMTRRASRRDSFDEGAHPRGEGGKFTAHEVAKSHGI